MKMDKWLELTHTTTLLMVKARSEVHLVLLWLFHMRVEHSPSPILALVTSMMFWME